MNKTDGIDELVGLLLDAGDSRHRFLDLVRRRPDVLSVAVQERLAGMRQSLPVGALFELYEQLVREARGDPGAAFEYFRRAMSESARRAEALAPSIEQAAQAMTRGLFAEAASACDLLLPRLTELGQLLSVRMLHVMRGDALLQLQSGDRDQNLRRAIQDYQAALELTDDPATAAQVLLHLGIAWGELPSGDRAANLENAVAATRAALEALPGDADAGTHARAESNLAAFLLRRERGDQLNNVREAVALCRSANEVRSPANNGVDWAHSQITLGDALERLATLTDGDYASSMAAHRAVLEHADEVGSAWLVGGAHGSIARLHRIEAARLSEAIDDDGLATNDPDETQRREQLREQSLQTALTNLEAARELAADAPDRFRLARIVGDAAEVAAAIGDHELTIARGNEALQTFTPTSAPRECAGIAASVAAALMDLKRYDEAAQLYDRAVDAYELSIHSRLDTVDRQREMQRAGRTYRWAAEAFGRTGRV